MHGHLSFWLLPGQNIAVAAHDAVGHAVFIDALQVLQHVNCCSWARHSALPPGSLNLQLQIRLLGFILVHAWLNLIHGAPQISLLSFRMQFIVAGPGLVPWMYDSQFLAGMTEYLGPNSGVGNLTIRNWAEVNLANFPVRPLPRHARMFTGAHAWALMVHAL